MALLGEAYGRGRPRGPAYAGGPKSSIMVCRRRIQAGSSHCRRDEGNSIDKSYAAIRDELVMTLAASGFGEKAAAIVNALEKLIEARIEMTRGR